MRYLAIIVIAILVYLQGIKPVVADYFYLLHKQGNKDAIAKALEWSPNNSMFLIETGQIDKVLATHNGDLTEYSLYFIKAVQMLQRGNPEGVAALQRSLWLYPDFAPAKDVMRQIQEQQPKK